ncbi:hypothetical protein MMC27_004612, partial [Xylographa pallens]|nr:hypothetical protein [Xylographa pallens]
MKLLSTLLWAAACITAVSAAKDTLECFGKTSPSKAYSASQTYDCVVTHRCDCVGGHVACFPPNALCAQVCECV